MFNMELCKLCYGFWTSEISLCHGPVTILNFHVNYNVSLPNTLIMQSDNTHIPSFFYKGRPLTIFYVLYHSVFYTIFGKM